MVENATPNGADSLPKFQGLAHGLCLRIACGITKAVVGYLFLDVFSCSFRSFLFYFSLLPFLFHSLSAASKWLLKLSYGERCYVAPLPVGKTTFAATRHVP